MALFVLLPIAVSSLQAICGMKVGAPITTDYILLLLCFGTTLQLLRIFTYSLWTSIGFHLTYLEISRFVILQREQKWLTYHENVPGTGELFILFFMTIVMPALLLGSILIIRR